MRRARWLAAVLVLAPAVAHADPESELGLGPRAAALAGAVSAEDPSAFAVAYNPAALVGAGDRAGFGELAVAFALAAPAVWAEPSDPARPLDLRPPPNAYAASVAGRFDVGSAFGLPGLALGLAIYAPVEGLVVSDIRPDDAPSWLMLGDRLLHIAIHAGLAYRIVDWLTVGAGVRITFDEEAFISGMAEGVRRVTDPETGEERIEAGTRLGVDSSIYGRAGPTAGITVAPHRVIRLAFAWRGRVISDDWGWSRLAGIEGVGDLGFVHRFTHVPRPDELAWSASVRPIDGLAIDAELTWQMWSRIASPNAAPLEGRFGDTLVPAVAARAAVHPGVEVAGGYREARRPFDGFGGPENLLANDAHQLALGLALDLDALAPEEPLPFTIRLSGRLSILEEREELKDGRRFASDRALLSNPGYPGYRYGGVVPSLQLGVEARW